MIITNLLANMVLLSSLDDIQTNTPAFQQYAYRTMVSTAQGIARTWHLDEEVILTNQVTKFVARPKILGAEGYIEFADRYHFGYIQIGLENFYDDKYEKGILGSMDFAKTDKIYDQWMHATNMLTMDSARKLAGDSLKAIGVKVDYYHPEESHQLTYTWKDGKKYYLPYYGFKWGGDRFNDEIHVSGIIGRPVLFSTFYHPIRIYAPTNYFDLLGLPKNPIFVKQITKNPPTYEVVFDPQNPPKK